MYCLSCGKKITENSKFCKYCGANQKEIDINEKKNLNKEYYETVWTCDFCGKEFKTKKESDNHELKCLQNPKNKKFLQNISPKKAWQYLWLTTMLIFLINIFIFTKYDDSKFNLLNGKFLSFLFLFNIGLGIISFLASVVSRNNPKKNKVSVFVKNSLIICFFYLIINSLVFAVEGNKVKNNETYRNKYYIKISPTPILEIKITPTITPKKEVIKNNIQQNINTKTNTNQSDQIDCTGPDGVVFKTTKEKCEKFNSDWGYKMPTPTLNPREWVKCSISANCGGGYKDMMREECNRMTCCQTTAKGWFLTSKEDCDNSQNGEIRQSWIKTCNIIYPDINGNCGIECYKCVDDHS